MKFRTETFRSLRHRDFRVFLGGQIISIVGVWAQRVAQGWLVYEITRSAAWLGIVDALTTAPMTFLAVVGGSLADRLRKRDLLIVINILGVAQAFVYAAFLWLGAIKIWIICVLALFIGIKIAFEVPVRQSYYIELVGTEDLANAIALNSAGFNVARLLGPAVAGPLIAFFDVGWCMFLNGVTYFFVILSLLSIRRQRRAGLPGKDISIFKSIRQAAGYAFRVRSIRGILLLIGVVTVFGWAYLVVLPVIARDHLGGGALELGNLFSAIGVGAFIAALCVAAMSDRILPAKMLVAGLTFFLAGVNVLVQSSRLAAALPAAGLAGFGLVMFYINANSALQRRVPDELRGRIMGFYALFFGGLMPLGSLQVGYISDHFGVAVAIMAGGGFIVTSAVLVASWLFSTPERPGP